MSARRQPRRGASMRVALAASLGLLVALVLAAVLAPPAPAAPAGLLQQTLTAPDGAFGDELGTSVAVQGDTVVIGAPGDDSTRGSVYVFQRMGDSWTETAKLTATDAASGDELGFSVAIDGNTIVAGAPFADIGTQHDQGAVYTFARTGAVTRVETGKLFALDGVASDELGSSVAIDGDTIVAGAAAATVGGKNIRQGAAYTFATTGTSPRTQTGKLTASDGGMLDGLGRSVAIDGDTIVAGAETAKVGVNVNQGAAYTFDRIGAAARHETAKLTASDGGTLDFFGTAVAIDGGTIVAGAPGHAFGSSRAQGSAYTFARTGAAARTETARLSASDDGRGGLFHVVASASGGARR